MGVVSCIELPRERQLSGRFGETYRYNRGFMIKVDDPSTPLTDISQAAGVHWMDPHPDDHSCVAQEFSLKPDSNSLLHYVQTVTYTARPGAQTDPDTGSPPEVLPGIPSVWTASSSVGTEPLTRDVNGVVIKNSAGTPMDRLETDQARFKLSLKRPWIDLTWQAVAREYTNAVNEDTWMGAPARCWKCQGMSAAPESRNAAGVTQHYWMTTWEFEYRAPWVKNVQGGGNTTHAGWDRGVVDRGYQAKVDEKGQPAPTPDYPIGTIRDAKGQPIKEPVGLRNGEVVNTGHDPDVLVFVVFRSKKFTPVFGGF